MKKYQKIVIFINLWRIIPCYFFVLTSKYREKIKKDIIVWKTKHQINSFFYSFCYFMSFHKEFRSLFLNRLHRNPVMFLITRCFFSPEKTLFINMPPEKIGGGMYIQHGFATIISAQEIGENFHVNQQVTIGYNSDKCPIIKNNVTICAGAIVIGDVIIDNNSIVGAGSVVTHNVEENSVVAGVPATKIR